MARSASPTGRRSRRCGRTPAAGGSTTGRTRCTAWSSRGGSSRRSSRGTVGGSGDVARRDPGVASGGFSEGDGLLLRGGGRRRAGDGRGAGQGAVRLGRPVPARAHELRTLLRE